MRRPAYSCSTETANTPGSTCANAQTNIAGIFTPKNSIGGMPSAPAVTGTKARIGGTKRAKKTASVPQLWKNASLCAITAGYFFIGQAPRISRCERWPAQNAVPSPSAAPAIAAASTPHNFSSPPGTSALRARMIVEPGTSAPTTGIASSRAARNSVR